MFHGQFETRNCRINEGSMNLMFMLGGLIHLLPFWQAFLKGFSKLTPALRCDGIQQLVGKSMPILEAHDSVKKIEKLLNQTVGKKGVKVKKILENLEPVIVGESGGVWDGSSEEWGGDRKYFGKLQTGHCWWVGWCLRWWVSEWGGDRKDFENLESVTVGKSGGVWRVRWGKNRFWKT